MISLKVAHLMPRAYIPVAENLLYIQPIRRSVHAVPLRGEDFGVDQLW
jgi:hypothetical protein